MPDDLEYIVKGALMMCDQGAMPSAFNPTHNSDVNMSKCLVTTAADKIGGTNILTFGVCGRKNGAACKPDPLMWEKTYKAKVHSEETLLFKSCIRCAVGGNISFITSGQVPLTDTQVQEIMNEAGITPEEREEEGGWGFWDYVELVPVVGSVVGIVRESLKGNPWMAALNVGFLVLDVVGLFSFGATTAASTAGKGALKVGIKASAKKLSAKALGDLGAIAFQKGGLKMLGRAGAEALGKAAAKAVDKIVSLRALKCVVVCFVEGTLVTTKNGSKPIEEINVGDEVWAFNERTGQTELRKVLRTMKQEADVTLRLRLGDEIIESTVEHPLYTKDGWKAAADLTENDSVKNRSGDWQQVKSIQFLYESKKVFNFEVEELHSYFVGALAWLVHNATECLHKLAAEGVQWAQNFVKGIRFNKIMNEEMIILATKKGLNYVKEVVVKDGEKLKRVDGVIEGLAYIERKATDLGKHSISEAKKLIDEVSDFYKEGLEFANPSRFIDEKKLWGQKFLQVEKIGDTAEEVFAYAEKKGVKIVETAEEIFETFGL